MRTVNIHEAKTHLSSLVEEAAQGESFIIAKAGKPMVKVTRLDAPKTLRRFGFLDGQYTVPEDFDTMFAEEIRQMFEGEGEED
jgi:prevent-host-death family protein